MHIRTWTHAITHIAHGHANELMYSGACTDTCTQDAHTCTACLHSMQHMELCNTIQFPVNGAVRREKCTE